MFFACQAGPTREKQASDLLRGAGMGTQLRMGMQVQRLP
jgi:hypothetical protein